MTILGLLLFLGSAGVTYWVIQSNPDIFTTTDSTIDFLGRHMVPVTGRVLVAGMVLGAIGMLGLAMMAGGMGRRGRRREVAAEPVAEHEHVSA